MLNTMDRIELKYYNMLENVHLKIKDKHEQEVYLMKLSAYDHGDVDGIDKFSKDERNKIKYYLREDVNPPY
jgi:hypothetical protein